MSDEITRTRGVLLLLLLCKLSIIFGRVFGNIIIYMCARCRPIASGAHVHVRWRQRDCSFGLYDAQTAVQTTVRDDNRFAGASICKQWLVQQASVKFIRRFWDKGRGERGKKNTCVYIYKLRGLLPNTGEAVFQPVVGGDDPRDAEIPKLTD